VVRSRQAERHSGFLVWGREGPDWPDDVASAEPTRPAVGRVSDVREPSSDRYRARPDAAAWGVPRCDVVWRVGERTTQCEARNLC